MTGLNTFSSKLPCEPAKPMAALLPCTCTHTMVMASHCVGFTLPGMIDDPGSFSGMLSLAQAAARAGGQPANVVRNLHQRAGQRFHRALRKDEFIVRRKRRELVGMRAEGKSRQLGDLLRGAFGKFRMRVQPRAHRRAADRQIVAVRRAPAPGA